MTEELANTNDELFHQEKLITTPVTANIGEHVKGDAHAARELLDSLIPLGGEIAQTVEQYGQAIVRFPKDANGVQFGWNDLMNRKTPGWEEWKQLGSLKDGKFQPMAAIKQAKVTPAAAANLALQGAALVVGQAYMTEINSQLEGINNALEAIQADMERTRKAKLMANYNMLKRYAIEANDSDMLPEKRQAIFNKLEDIRNDADEAWLFQLETMRELQSGIAKSKRMSEAEVKARIKEVEEAESKAAAAFQLMAATEQVSMSYEGNHSSKRLEEEYARIEACLETYSDVRGSLQEALHSQITSMKGRGLARPAKRDDEYRTDSPIKGAAHKAVVQLERVTPAALIGEGKRAHTKKKNAYHSKASASSPVDVVASSKKDDLADMNYMYNEADVLIIDRDGVRFASSEDIGAN